MRIRNLRCDHLTEALGFALDQPTFTWTVEGARGKKQASARLEISRDSAFADTLYDSGEQADLSSVGVTPELSLAPRTRYHYRVTVKSDAGETAQAASWFETGKRNEHFKGQWIAAPYEDSVHPVLGTTFTVDGPVKSARLYASALGVYEASINGVKAGDEILAPFFNDYNHWVQVQTYDVTELLRPGKNQISAMLGSGWYSGRFGFGRDIDKIYGDGMQLLAELRVTMADGSTLTVGTDESWLCARGPAMASNIYDGETWDARKEGARLKDKAVKGIKPKGKLTDRLSPPVRVIETIKNPKVLTTPAGETVLDFGQVLTGWVEFDVNLPRGSKVTLQHGELLQHGNFYNENLRTAKQEYHYISAGRPAHVRPHFTFYGFRFVKVTGMTKVDAKAFTACVIHSDLDEIGTLKTSNSKVNRLIANARWGQKGNFLDVPTDCPQRDERMGWTGDAQVFAPTASYNMYTPAFFKKYLHDMLLEQQELDGSVPHVVPDVLGQIGRKRTDMPFRDSPSGSCAWGDAATMIPWTVYQFFGDKALLARQYDNMKLWVEWIKKQDDTHCNSERLWRCGFHFADWLALDNPVQGSPFGGTDAYYVASAYYYYSTMLTAKAAKALGYQEDAARYTQLAREIKAAFRKEFFTATGRISEPTQTAMAIALKLDLVPSKHRERLIGDLKKKLANRKFHLDTGFVGTYFLPSVLSDNGLNDIAYTLLLNEDYPSWLYEVNMGATTVWERWNSVLPNGLVSDTGMNSMNHYAYGSIVEWMYRYMVGLNPDPNAPGFKRAVIAPMPDPRMRSVKAK
ncbi:MAG: family 78 glycoside hydrolase catalytic domain [Clostridiales bacterium]|nr:family 78 glycoside hydrolase catalytic domain [Clostridiales bacterium]